MVTKEQVNEWLETGYRQEAMAGFGTSVEDVNKLIETGLIPWHRSADDLRLLPHQRKLLRHGGYLYFAYPFIEPIKKQNPRWQRGF